MQQRLGGNAADIEAYPAQHRPALHQHHLHAEIRGAERGGVAARTGAEHEELRRAVEIDLVPAAACSGRACACAPCRPRDSGFAAGWQLAAGAAAGDGLGAGAEPPVAAGALGVAGGELALAPAWALVSRRAITDPLDTLSPRFRSTSAILPAAVAGTSMDALSVSSVTSGVSTSISSPALTSTSTTATSWKLPRSGTDQVDPAHGTASIKECGSASVLTRKVVKRTALAPSMTRWS